MKTTRIHALLLVCAASGAIISAISEARAGAFAIREQSAYGQGSSFAGVAAGGALSSIYWNPATMTQFGGKTIELGTTLIIPQASHTYTTSALAAGLGALVPAFTGTVDDLGDDAAVPTGYASWQLAPQLWAGLSLNSPFALSVGFPQMWAGAGYGQNADIKSYNAAPSLAYKINDMISVAVGVQVQYMTVSYTAALPGFPTTNSANITGSGYSYGFTAGVTLTPLPATQIGVGYRSALDQKIDGTLTASGGAGNSVGSVNTTLHLPDLLSVGLRQGIGDRFTLLAGFEWQNWGRIGTAALSTPSGPATLGGAAVTFPFQYSDSEFYSLGGEYIYDPALKLRAGIAFEKSPITDGVRTPRLPDNDRMWYSVGATYKHPTIKGLTFDLGYSYIDVKDTPINISAASGNPWLNATGTYIGSVRSNVNIVSLSARYQLSPMASR